MPNYNTFEQVLKDNKLDETAKNGFIKRWLRSSYNIDFDSNSGFFTELTRVHDHDNQPKHFGRVMLNTAFRATWVQVVRLPGSNAWRLALFTSQEDNKPVLLAPANGTKADRAGTREALQQFKALVAPPARDTNAQGDGVQYGNPDTYGGAAVASAEFISERQSQVTMYTIPAYLYDPNYVPGNPDGTTNRVDPSLNRDFEQVVAAFTAA